MNKQVQKTGMIACILAAVFVIFTLLVKFVDVQPIGPLESSVGFAKLNGAFFNTFGPNKVCYVISTIGGLICLMTAALFAGIGFYQLFKRKSLAKVDKNIIAMGVVYVLFVIFYVLFDKAVVNYRPVLEDGALESSFPSTHALMAVLFMGCALIECNEAVTRKSTLKYIVIFCWAVMAVCLPVFTGLRILSAVFFSERRWYICIKQWWCITKYRKKKRNKKTGSRSCLNIHRNIAM